MILSLKHAAGFWFYTLALLMLAGLIAVRGNVPVPTLPTVLSTLDLPLIAAAILYGASALYVSLTREKKSVVLMCVIGIPAIALFGFFCFLNFGYPAVNLIAG